VKTKKRKGINQNQEREEEQARKEEMTENCTWRGKIADHI
jgi:hypothetical protein